MLSNDTGHLYALVDMGSNGIRYSITDVSAPGARALPTVYQERLGVSLYDAQYETGTKAPIPQSTIDQIVSSLKRFKRVCMDFGVHPENIKILATEATRAATNSAEYIKQLESALKGWGAPVMLLPKETEGKIGAMGVASSFNYVSGLMMDLGGGSTQITWMKSDKGELQTSPVGSVSFPYGAAALTHQLGELDASNDLRQGRDGFHAKLVQQFKDAVDSLKLPDDLRQRAKERGLTLYLSGGGFRGWGYLLMNKHRVQPYPIPIINGLCMGIKEFKDVNALKELASGGQDLFRVSKRRASQVPAVAFLVSAVVEAIPFIKDIRFCQGGVREGFLFDSLPTEVKAQDPLTAATTKYARDTKSAEKITDLLYSAIPGENNLDRSVPTSCRSKHLLQAMANLMYLQSSSSKESASVVALYVPITGALASTHGVSHVDRALLGLMLNERWAGDLPPPHNEFADKLSALLTQQEAWWAKYIGCVARLVGEIYPAGIVPENRVSFKARWQDGIGGKGNQHGILLDIFLSNDSPDEDAADIVNRELIGNLVREVEAVGKKKNRVGGKQYGFGMPVQVELHRN